MRIFDCFTYLDESELLDLRLNILDKYIYKFIIIESKYRHNGETKKKNFDIKNFSKFKDKIKYFYLEKEPEEIFDIKKKFKESEIIKNAYLRENFQRNSILLGLNEARNDDFILISDVDEIPNLENINFSNYKNSLLFFKQKMFYYKLNLIYKNFIWHGTKGCFKKKFLHPQWIRNIKNKNYPWWRIDIAFSKTKYNNIKFIDNGGWHFTNIKKPEDVYKKLKTFLHHYDFEQSNVSFEQIKKNINDQIVGYDHSSDQKDQNKWNKKIKLDIASYKDLPNYLLQNKKKYLKWLENENL